MRFTIVNLLKRTSSVLLGVGFVFSAVCLIGPSAALANAPLVTEVYPIDGQENVPYNISAKVTFNSDMDKSSFDDDGAIMIVGPNWSSVPISKSWEGNRTIVLNPTNGLSANTSYTILVRGEGLDGTIVGVMDTNGNQLEANYMSNFETGDVISAAPISGIVSPVVLDNFVRFQPQGFTQNVVIPRGYVIMSQHDLQSMLDALPPTFHPSEEVKIIGHYSDSAASWSGPPSDILGSEYTGSFGENMINYDYNLQGGTLTIPFYKATDLNIQQ